MRSFTVFAVFGLTLSTAAQADELFNDDVIVSGNICAGGGCVDGETFGATDIMIKSSFPELQFVDTSVSDSTWTVSVDDPASGVSNGFSIKNETNLDYPFVIEEDAPDDAMFISDSGTIGLGTTIPQANVHIADGAFAEARIRLEDTLDTPYIWDLRGNHGGFYLYDVTGGGKLPFQVRPGAPTSSIEIASTGWVGIGTGSPGAPFELSNDDTFSYFRITAEDAAVNQSVDITFTGGPLGTGQLRYNIVDGDNQEMSLDADGNMILDGTLTTGGPTCARGCDAVFTEGQIIPERDYAAQMWADGHLPHVGPTGPDAPFNMTEKMGGMLNALEHAHIYIERQRDEMAQMKADKAAQDAQIAAQAAQLAALTARLEALERQD